MENITIGQIGAFLGIIVSFSGSIGAIILLVQKLFKKGLKNELKPIINQIDVINTNIQTLDVSQCKNFLVRFLADIEQGNDLDEVEKERAYEIYDHYINDLKQNSYIHKRWEELMERNNKNGKNKKNC